MMAQEALLPDQFILDPWDHPTPPMQQFEPTRDRLLLERGIRVAHHPNHLEEHEMASPRAAANCMPDQFLPCARVMWNPGHLPDYGDIFLAQVTPVVSLHGPGGKVLWRPVLHCMTFSLRRGRQWASPPGGSCDIHQGATPQRMEWIIGGSIEGLDEEVPGIYEGAMQLTVIRGQEVWDMDIPIRYELFQKLTSCTVSGSSTSFSGLTEKVAGTVETALVTQVGTGGISWFTAEISSEEHTGATGSWGSFTLTIDPPALQNSSTIRIGPAFFDAPKPPVGTSWKHVVGYYDANGIQHIDTKRSLDFTGADLYWDSGGRAVIFMGAELTVTDKIEAGASYTGSATITVSCG